MCLNVAHNVLLTASAQGAHRRTCHNWLIKSIKKISRHFLVQTLSMRNHIKDNIRSSVLEVDIALEPELTLPVCTWEEGGSEGTSGWYQVTGHTAVGTAWALETGSSPGESGDTTPHSFRLITAQRTGLGRMGAAPTQPKREQRGGGRNGG